MALNIKVIEVIFIRGRWNPFSASLHTEPAPTLFDFMLLLVITAEVHSNIK